MQRLEIKNGKLEVYADGIEVASSDDAKLSGEFVCDASTVAHIIAKWNSQKVYVCNLMGQPYVTSSKAINDMIKGIEDMLKKESAYKMELIQELENTKQKLKEADDANVSLSKKFANLVGLRTRVCHEIDEKLKGKYLPVFKKVNGMETFELIKAKKSWF